MQMVINLAPVSLSNKKVNFYTCPKLTFLKKNAMGNADKSIYELVDFKIFCGGMPPHSPSGSHLRRSNLASSCSEVWLRPCFESENFRFPLLTCTQMERFERSLIVSGRFSLVTYSVTDSAQIISVRKASLWREYVTRHKCPFSLLIGVRIKGVKFRENVWAFCQDKQNYPLCTHGCPY